MFWSFFFVLDVVGSLFFKLIKYLKFQQATYIHIIGSIA